MVLALNQGNFSNIKRIIVETTGLWKCVKKNDHLLLDAASEFLLFHNFTPHLQYYFQL